MDYEEYFLGTFHSLEFSYSSLASIASIFRLLDEPWLVDIDSVHSIASSSGQSIVASLLTRKLSNMAFCI